MTESFPRQEARTRRFTLGVPRAFRVSPDGARVAFLRTKSGADAVTGLWGVDVDRGRARPVAVTVGAGRGSRTGTPARRPADGPRQPGRRRPGRPAAGRAGPAGA